MNNFLKKVGIWFLLVAGVHIWLGFYANGFTDPFYLRFASPKQSSLIIGSSRAAQGLVPHVLDSVIDQCDDGFYNFAFTVAHSPYGPVYFNAIKSKLKQNENCHGLHIVTVNPWSLSYITKDPEDVSKFRENNLALGNTKFFNLNPNYFYLLNNYNQGWFNLLKSDNDSYELMEDGWLRINVNMSERTINSRTESKVKHYQEKNMPNSTLSNTRIFYLIETIKLLQESGKVFLVRLPVGQEILNIENVLSPSFNHLMDSISTRHEISYFDFTDHEGGFTFTDGNHLYHKSSKKFSELVGNNIKKDMEGI